MSWEIKKEEFEHPVLQRTGKDKENWEAFKEFAKEREMTLEEIYKIANNIKAATDETKRKIISQTKLS